MDDGIVGAPLTRLEDHDLLTGNGQFVDDIRLPGTLHAAFVRSPHAHAALTGMDLAAARALDGVHGVYALADLMPHMTTDRVPPNFPGPGEYTPVGPYVLAGLEVCHVGEVVAIAIADTRYLAEDACSLVMVDYDPLPVVADCRAALADDAPPVDRREATNLVRTITLGCGDIEAAFAGAAHVVQDTFFQHRGCCTAMECRGIVARFDPIDGKLTAWRSGQAPHSDRSILVRLMGLEENAVRVITPDVGGGFGPKLIFYPEEAAVCVVSAMLGRPVKWIEDRREHFLATTQERDQVWEVEMAVDERGVMQGLRGRMTHDQGAYTARGINIPFNSATTILGPYVVPNYAMEVRVANTNKVPVTSLRGAGHPQGAFTMERLLDRVAEKLGLDRAEVRRRNMIAPEMMPYEHGVKTQAGKPIIYDSGNYVKCQADLLAAIDYDGFPARQAAAREDGRYLGIGLANYVKPTGRGPYETGLVRIGTSGKVLVYTGAVAMGQGFRTAMAQLCAEQLGVAPADVSVVAGDTDGVAMGFGGFASRQTVTAGSSIHLAAVQVREKIIKVAAHMLEAAEGDLDLADGRVHVKGVSDLSLSLGEVANAVAGTPGYALPGGIEPGMEAMVNFKTDNVVYANGAHAVEVEVDPATGGVRILRYVMVHDSGRLINPLIVDGQVHGAIAMGIGNALFERMVFDDHAQPMTTTLAEYLVASATDLPSFEILHQVSPTDRNPLGVKGVGECGVMAAAPAVLSAIEDALAPFGVHISHAPVSPADLVQLISEHS